MNKVVETVFELIDPSYLVGGSLRDALLGREISDYDFATPRTPDEVEAAVRADERRPYLTGRRFGTIGFKVDGHFIEVTSFRGEIYKRGSRKPDVIFDTTLEEDLARRDFTINAMAQGADGVLLDYFGGREDLVTKTIRAVGDPVERFTDDPLRMLRAARFASQLDFEIEPLTLAAMKSCAPELVNVAIQRCAKELDLLLTGANPARGMGYLIVADIFELYLPELTPLLLDELTFGEVLTSLAESPATPEDRWAALLSPVALPFVQNEDPAARNYVQQGLISKIGTYLRWPKARIKAVSVILSEVKDPIDISAGQHNL